MKKTKAKVSYSEFMEIVFPYETTFEREQFGFFTNLIKFFSLRVAYLLYRLNISANLLTIFSILMTLPCFYLLYEGINLKNLSYLCIGYFLIGLILFIDFADGSLARINKFSFAAGEALDDLPTDIIRIGSILYFGVITGSKIFVLLAFVSSAIVSYYLPATLNNIQENRNWIRTVYASRMALTGLRIITLFLMPIITITTFFFKDIGIFLAQFVVIIYFFLSFLWVLFTLEDKERRQ